ncbi:MAG: urea ABC transporter permease subunit UrtB [Burkholderiales bacterium]
MKNVLLKIAVVLAALAMNLARAAIDPQTISKLATGDNDEKVAAVAALVATAEPRAREILEALEAGELQTAGERVLIVKGDDVRDAVTGDKVSPKPPALEDVIANNRLRREVGVGLAALRLTATDRTTRLAAAKALASGADQAMLPLLKKAFTSETDAEIRPILEMTLATLELQSEDKTARLGAIKKLAESRQPSAKTLLLTVLEKTADGQWVESDEPIRDAARSSLRAVEGRLAWSERAGLAFAGISLGSILLLAALGLAITYGLMGVINMAHGELIMIGAYTTYVVQNLVRAYAPGVFDIYLFIAIPASFLVAAAVGMILERSVIRFLYGRPLETLLATWGISLVLMQTVRTIFGAQNVQVENPSWMSGGMEILSGVVLPWSRIAIVFFAALVLAGMWLLLTKTRLGLFVRGVTQNRSMAACVGVPTGRVDTWAFGLGSGIAGLAGCALSQIGNVGPDLGQAYIVDSFMVVVLGGVGQLAGTVYAALGLGFANKLLESWSGAVLAKIAVLVFIIVFIQKRPQGLFALKGRAVDA